MGDFLQMGGYAGYVWSCYGLALVVMLALLIDSRLRLKQSEIEFERLDGERKRRKEQRA